MKATACVPTQAVGCKDSLAYAKASPACQMSVTVCGCERVCYCVTFPGVHVQSRPPTLRFLAGDLAGEPLAGRMGVVEVLTVCERLCDATTVCMQGCWR